MICGTQCHQIQWGALPPGPMLYAGAYVVLHRLDVFARGNHEKRTIDVCIAHEVAP